MAAGSSAGRQPARHDGDNNDDNKNTNPPTPGPTTNNNNDRAPPTDDRLDDEITESFSSQSTDVSSTGSVSLLCFVRVSVEKEVVMWFEV